MASTEDGQLAKNACFNLWMLGRKRKTPESRPKDALSSHVETLETLEAVGTVESVETVEIVENVKIWNKYHLITDNLKARANLKNYKTKYFVFTV